jgi:hypothetical protein
VQFGVHFNYLHGDRRQWTLGGALVITDHPGRSGLEVGGKSHLDPSRSRFIGCGLEETRCKIMLFECITQVQAPSRMNPPSGKPASVIIEADN